MGLESTNMNGARIYPISLVPNLMSFLVFYVVKMICFFAGSATKNVCPFRISHACYVLCSSY